MDIQTANTLFDQGVLTAMYKAGFITTKVLVNTIHIENIQIK